MKVKMSSSKFILFIKVLFVVALSAFLSGCLSPEEQQARRDNAFDINGTWQTTKDSELQLNFEIINQQEKSDILVTLTRTSPVTEEEKQLLSKAKKEHGINSEDILNPPTQITLGEEPNPLVKALSGGENISDNFGKSSRFYVCDDSPPEYKSTQILEDKKNIKLKVLYCLSGTVKKESKNLIEEGKFSLNIIQSYDSANGSGLTNKEEVDLKYEAQKTSE